MENITNISSETNLKYDEYWEISEKKLLKICQKLENSDFRFQKQPLGAFNFEKTILDQFSYENCIP